jgi:hypothetical protein
MQTFKPHKEKHETTVPKSPLLRTKLRSHTVGWLLTQPFLLSCSANLS